MTVLHWEKGYTEPAVTFLPAVLAFLGYDPYPQGQTLPERLAAKRRAMGWSIEKAANAADVDPGTWRDWERGRAVLLRGDRKRLATLLDMSYEDLDRQMRERWKASHEPSRQHDK